MGRFKQNDKYKRVLISYNNKVFYKDLQALTIIFQDTGKNNIENLMHLIYNNTLIMYTFRHKNIQYYVYNNSLFTSNVVLIDKRDSKLVLYNANRNELISDMLKGLLDYLYVHDIELHISSRSKKNNIIVNPFKLASTSRRKQVLTAALALL